MVIFYPFCCGLALWASMLLVLGESPALFSFVVMSLDGQLAFTGRSGFLYMVQFGVAWGWGQKIHYPTQRVAAGEMNRGLCLRGVFCHRFENGGEGAVGRP